MTSAHDATGFFPAFLAEEEAARNDAAAKVEAAHQQDHWRSLRLCWPDWEGPIVTTDPEDPAGYCSVNHCGPHYMAPCRILAVHDGGNRLDVEVAYPRDAPAWCIADNGTKLTLTGDEIWAPTRLLWARHHAASVAEAIAAGRTCACGATPAHVYGTGFECGPCRTARLAPDPPPPKKPRKAKPATA